MKFYTETITGDLILIKTNINTAPPCPVLIVDSTAQPVPVGDPWLIRLVLFLAAILVGLMARPRVVVFSILVTTMLMVMAESIAQKFLNSVLAVMTS